MRKSFCQSMAAEFALGYARIEADPLKSWDVIRACDRAVAATDALFGTPVHNSTLGILMQRLEWTSGGAGGIQAMHTLTLDE
jgi:hypothetical protein